MPTLLLLRHGKSSWDDPALDDFDRPLAPRGRRATLAIAREMRRLRWLPDAALVSSATRTRQTWKIVAGKLGTEIPARFERSIHEAEPAAVLASIRRQSGSPDILLVVGHNPGLEQLSMMLASDDSDEAQLSRLSQKFPTGALARFTFDGEWRDLARARLESFIKPRELD